MELSVIWIGLKMTAEQKRYDQVENIIRRSKALILNVKLLGADTTYAKELLDSAKAALDQGDYNTAIDYAKKSMVEVISLKKQVQSGSSTQTIVQTLPQRTINQTSNKNDQEELTTTQNDELMENDNTLNSDEIGSDLKPEIQSTKTALPKPASISSLDVTKPEFLKKFEESFSYLIEENRANACFKIFSSFTSKGYTGLCICRINPNIIRRKYHLNEELTTVLWLTDRDSSQEATISPSLESMIYVAEEFIDKTDKGIILLDGLEYLISNNSFNPVLRFIRRLIDRISETMFIMLIGVSTKAIQEQELRLLQRELNPIII